MHYATFIASLFAAVTVVGAVPALEQRTKTCYKTEYVCPSTADSLECCTGNISAGAAKTGCSPYDNNSSRAPCDPSQIYCCGAVVGEAGNECVTADVEQMQISCT